MENALLVLFVVAGVVIYRRFLSMGVESSADRATIALLRKELDSLREAVSELTEQVECVTLTPTEQEAKHYERLPALTSDFVSSLTSGEKLCLVLKTSTEDGFPLFYEIEYVHGELTYRSPGNKDPAAYGKSRLDTSTELEDVRILFSRPHASAALRGLALEGHVKQGRLLPNNSFKPNPLRRFVEMCD